MAKDISYFDAAVETAPRERLERLQVERLRQLIAEIYGRNPFYTRKLKEAGVKPEDIRSLDDLRQLPFTTKGELMADQEANPPFGSNLTYPLERYTRYHQTSGTTGKPLKVLDTAEDWEGHWGRCWGHVLKGAGVSSEDRVFVAFSFGPFIGFWAVLEGLRKIGGVFVPGGGTDSLQRLFLIQESQATVLCCTPTYALRLAEVARENGTDVARLPVRITIHAGEPGASIPEVKRRIEATWGARCFDHAGASEVGAHSFECQVQPGGIHVNESEFILEVLDPQTGKPVPQGSSGELVLTNLGRRGFPAIRYRTGDIVRPNYETCDCGRTYARLEGGIIGRADDMFIVRGVNVFPSAVENIIRTFPEVAEFRVTLYRERELDEMLVEIELAGGLEGKGEEIVPALVEKFRVLMGFRPRVEVVERGSLPRFELKARRFRKI